MLAGQVAFHKALWKKGVDGYSEVFLGDCLRFVVLDLDLRADFLAGRGGLAGAAIRRS
jgi:hypothetical protein